MPGIGIFALVAGSVAVSVPASASPPANELIGVAPGVALHAIESGRANAKPPIVFIPGWSAGADIWRGQMEHFDDGYRVISFDPRSQGESSKVTSGNTPEQRAVDLHALLAAKHVVRPVLVGWSQAAQDVAAYVSQYGTRDLAGIVLVDAAVSEGAKRIATRPEAAAAQFGRFATYVAHQEDYLRGMFGAIISKPQPPGMIDRSVATAMKTPPSTGVAMLVADLFGIDRTAALARMDCPVLIIAAGRTDELALQQAEAKLIKNARFVQIEDSAHAVFLDQPDRFSTVLARFIKELDITPKH